MASRRHLNGYSSNAIIEPQGTMRKPSRWWKATSPTLKLRSVFIKALLAISFVVGIPSIFWRRDSERFPFLSWQIDQPFDPALLHSFTQKPSNPQYAPDDSLRIIGEYNEIKADFPVDYEWLDSDTRIPFVPADAYFANLNGALVKLPVQSPYDAFAIGRGWSNTYGDESDGFKARARNTTLVAFFVKYDDQRHTWERAGDVPYVLEIPVWRPPTRACPERGECGPEDPRFIWYSGQPLLIYGTSSQLTEACRSMAIADLRTVWPEFAALMRSIGYTAPVHLTRPVELGQKGDKVHPYEKNWAPFIPGNAGSRKSTPFPLIHTNLVPQTIVKVSSETRSNLDSSTYLLTETIPTSPTSEACVLEALPGKRFHDIHHATPFHRVTMCPRGTCRPSSKNTVLLSLAHWKQYTYRRFFVTMSVNEPFEFLSISDPVHFGAEEHDEKAVFSVSMDFFPGSSLGEGTASGEKQPSYEPSYALQHGWLDDTVVISGGYWNHKMVAYHMPMSEVLSGHHICQ